MGVWRRFSRRLLSLAAVLVTGVLLGIGTSQMQPVTLRKRVSGAES